MADTSPDRLDRPGLLPELLGRALRERPDAVIVRTDDAAVTRRQLDGASLAHARRLAAAGAGPGVVVATLLPQGVDAMVGFLGAARSGAAVCGLSPASPPAELAAQARRIGARLAVTDAATAPLVRSVGLEPIVVDPDLDADPDAPGPALPVPTPDDVAGIGFTSGTGSAAKAVARRFGSRSGPFARPHAAIGDGAANRIGVLRPFGSPWSMLSLWTAIRTGAVLCVADDNGWEAAEHVAFYEQHRVTVGAFAAGDLRRIFHHLDARGGGLPFLEELSFAGERLFAPDVAAFRRLLPADATLLYTYGSTETSTIASVRFGNADPPPVEPYRFTTIAPGLSVRVENRDGGAVPAGEEGEIVVRGEPIAHGYVEAEPAVAARFFRDPDGTRGYRTGDVGRFHPDGSLELRGRVDDAAKVRGVMVRTGDVEAGVRGVPGVRDCAVVARLDEHEFHRLVAFVVPTGSGVLDPDGVLARAATVLPPEAVPHEVHVVDALPRTSSGKPDRRALRTP